MKPLGLLTGIPFFLTLVAFVEPMTGLVFMFFLGVIHLITMFFLWGLRKRIVEKSRKHLKLYTLLVGLFFAAVATVILLEEYISGDPSIVLFIVFPMLIGAYFVYLTSTISYKNEL